MYSFKRKMKKTMTFLAALISAASAYSANPKQETLDTLRSYQLQDVQVVATRASKKTPMAFTNMSQEQIKRLNTGRDIPFLLATMPSLLPPAMRAMVWDTPRCVFVAPMPAVLTLPPMVFR